MGKVMFLHLSVILITGGGGDVLPGQGWGGLPAQGRGWWPTRMGVCGLPGGGEVVYLDTGVEYPLGGRPLHPPPSEVDPLGGRTPPPPAVNRRSVRILLECILVSIKFNIFCLYEKLLLSEDGPNIRDFVAYFVLNHTSSFFVFCQVSKDINNHYPKG